MLRGIRLLGSLAFVIGLFGLIFVVIPWYVIVVEDGTVDGHLPWWVRGLVFALIGGIAVVLVTVAVEQAICGPKRAELEAIEETAGMVMVNTEDIPGRDVTEVLGLVQGHTIYAIWLGRDISALIRLILGGELIEYTQMMGRARLIARQRMEDQARALGADAVVNVRYMTTSVIGAASELLAYGTAVKLG